MTRGRLALAVLALVAAPRAHPQVQPASLAGWSGWARCRIDVQGRGYTGQQTHTWTITSSTPTR